MEDEQKKGKVKTHTRTSHMGTVSFLRIYRAGRPSILGDDF